MSKKTRSIDKKVFSNKFFEELDKEHDNAKDFAKRQKELKEKKNLTVLMAEQNFNQAIKIADRGYSIVHGEIEFTAESAEDLANNEMIKQYYLGV